MAIVKRGVALLACIALGACGGGGSGDKTFEREGVSFTYPADWEEREIGEVTPGAAFITAFAPGEGLNGLIFEINEGGPPVDESNIDAVAEDVAGALQESTEGPNRLTVDGLPALRIVSHPQSGLARQITSVFDGTTAYVFDCGFTPERSDEMQRGCSQALESFKVG